MSSRATCSRCHWLREATTRRFSVFLEPPHRVGDGCSVRQAAGHPSAAAQVAVSYSAWSEERLLHRQRQGFERRAPAAHGRSVTIGKKAAPTGGPRNSLGGLSGSVRRTQGKYSSRRTAANGLGSWARGNEADGECDCPWFRLARVPLMPIFWSGGAPREKRTPRLPAAAGPTVSRKPSPVRVCSLRLRGVWRVHGLGGWRAHYAHARPGLDGRRARHAHRPTVHRRGRGTPGSDRPQRRSDPARPQVPKAPMHVIASALESPVTLSRSPGVHSADQPT